MKTIKIPMNNNPFTVVINNSVYRYKAGETVEVPDEVAEAIENALELEPKPIKYLSKIAQLAEGSIEELTAKDFEGISAIANSAFVSCRSLTKVTIPSNLTKLGDSAFNSCSNLARVYLPEMPPSIAKTSVFANIKEDCVFYCKTQESLEAYRTAANWSTLASTYAFVVEE